jgi:folate-binding protein YgfZ
MKGLYRLPDRHLIEVHGQDRVRWLHNVCTNDILQLATGKRGDSFAKNDRVRMDKTPHGRGCFAAICSRQGKLLADCTVRLHEDYALLETGWAGLRDHLERLIIMEDLRLDPREASVHRLFGADAMLNLPPFWFATQADNRTIASPTPFGTAVIGEYSEKAGTISDAEYEAARIEAGWPKWGVDMDATVLPMEAGLEPIAISYTKGCYIGQEVIQRVKTYSEAPRMLVQLEGDGLSVGEIDGGRVTSVAGRLALAYVKKDLKAPGTRLPNGAVVRELPWWKAVSAT